MMNLKRAAFVVLVLAFAAMAQDDGPTSPLFHRGTAGESASEAAHPTLTVPAETEFKVQVLSGIHSQINHINDPVIAEVLNPVLVEGKIALPPGSLLDGHITLIHNAGHMHRSAELGLHFDRITLPNGRKNPLPPFWPPSNIPRGSTFTSIRKVTWSATGRCRGRHYSADSPRSVHMAL